MIRRKPQMLEEDDTTVGASGAWIFGPDGLLCSEVPGIRTDRACVSASFSLDPRDIEVDLNSLLGRGAAGIVTRAVHRPTGTPLAIKQMQLHDKSKREQLMNDVRTLVEAQSCRYLVHFYAAYFHKESGRVHLALELMDMGSLHDVMKRINGPIPERFIGTIVYQILQGLAFLHGHKHLHRDIKPGNILLHSDGSVKLSDFGISKTLDNTANVCDTFVGTATYMSPERCVGQDYSFCSDIWSLGMVIFEMASGRFPFPATASFPVLFDCLCHRPEPRLEEGVYSEELRALVAACLQREPLQRPRAAALLEDNFFSKMATIENFSSFLSSLK